MRKLLKYQPMWLWRCWSNWNPAPGLCKFQRISTPWFLYGTPGFVQAHTSHQLPMDEPSNKEIICPLLAWNSSSQQLFFGSHNLPSRTFVSISTLTNVWDRCTRPTSISWACGPSPKINYMQAPATTKDAGKKKTGHKRPSTHPKAGGRAHWNLDSRNANQKLAQTSP